MGVFDNIKPGDQIEMSAHRDGGIWGLKRDLNPNRITRVAVVTHRWHDPVEGKDYIGIAMLMRGGVYGKPTAKHTPRGLATNGWKPASRDWIAFSRDREAGVEAGKVVPIFKRP